MEWELRSSTEWPRVGGMTNTTETRIDYTYKAQLAILANSAGILVELAGMSADKALEHTATERVAASKRAAARTGEFERTLSRENAEIWAFAGLVAADVLRNTHRPSVGNCRDYALALMA